MCVFGNMQENGPDSMADCVYGLAANVANIMVITWTTPNLTITHHIQYQYCPFFKLVRSQSMKSLSSDVLSYS